MIVWLMFSMAVGVGASFLAGSAEVDFLGPYMSQSPVYSIFQLMTTWGEEGFIKAAIFTFTNFPDVITSLVSALTFEYAVLTQDLIGMVIRMVLIVCVSFPVLLGIFIEVAPRFLPWGR